MEIKKSEKASLENKRLLFTEAGLVIALLIVYFAFNWSSREAKVAALEDTTQVVVEEEMIAIQDNLPPPPPEAPSIPVLSDQIDIVDDDIKLDDDLFINLEDNNQAVEIQDYKEAAVEEEEVEEEAIPFQLVEQKPSFNGGDANEFSKWVNSLGELPPGVSGNCQGKRCAGSCNPPVHRRGRRPRDQRARAPWRG